jgi:hypothetical protein
MSPSPHRPPCNLFVLDPPMATSCSLSAAQDGVWERKIPTQISRQGWDHNKPRRKMLWCWMANGSEADEACGPKNWRASWMTPGRPPDVSLITAKTGLQTDNNALPEAGQRNGLVDKLVPDYSSRRGLPHILTVGKIPCAFIRWSGSLRWADGRPAGVITGLQVAGKDGPSSTKTPARLWPVGDHSSRARIW